MQSLDVMFGQFALGFGDYEVYGPEMVGGFYDVIDIN